MVEGNGAAALRRRRADHTFGAQAGVYIERAAVVTALGMLESGAEAVDVLAMGARLSRVMCLALDDALSAIVAEAETVERNRAESGGGSP